jgi:hypothetical protein
MSENRQPSFENEATLEELAGIGKNRRFDEAIDDEENEEIQVICKRGDDEIPLAKPSRAFYFGDRNLYDQEAKRYSHEEKARILNTDQFPRNLACFDELKKSCQRGFVIPFVGAGMSVGARLPSWTGYLLRLCRDAGLDQAAMRDRLQTTGDYEGAINDIITKIGLTKFERDFERDFTVPDTIEGPVTILPKLFNRCAVTTNFDRVLEKAYEQEGVGFIEKVTGRGNSNAFYRAIPSGDRYLLKLHGNVDNAHERVLLKEEYEAAYGPGERNVHFDSPLPVLLKRLFISYSFLFLGCSLATDRTVITFMKVGQELGGEQLPHHYAVLECPAEPRAKEAIDQRLAQAHITPLWYPESGHEHVEQILQLLFE